MYQYLLGKVSTVVEYNHRDYDTSINIYQVRYLHRYDKYEKQISILYQYLLGKVSTRKGRQN